MSTTADEPARENENQGEDHDNLQIEPVPQRSLELNLDFLRNGVLEGKCSPESPTLNSPDTPELLKVVLLGAPGVGKTSIVQQFVWNNFTAEYTPTSGRHTYYPRVVTGGRVYALKITDLPALPFFPVSSVYDCQGHGLRDASAYMLVLDLSNLDTFLYLDSVRGQIAESRDISALPFLVVGNKIDLFDTEDEDCLARRRQVMDTVKDEWQCGYAECSARNSAMVCQVFRHLIHVLTPSTTALTYTKCQVL